MELYITLLQSSDIFEDFADNFELDLDEIANRSQYLLVVLDDFSVKSSNW